MSNPKIPTTICMTCKKTVTLDRIYRNFSLALQYPDGVGFQCSSCGRLIAQAFKCPKCGQLTIKDLTVDWVRPDVCLSNTKSGACTQTFHPQHFVELPIS